MVEEEQQPVEEQLRPVAVLLQVEEQLPEAVQQELVAHLKKKK